MKTLILLLAISMAAGCASMADGMSKAAGIGVVSEKTTTFDGSKTISATPAPLWAPGSIRNNVWLGALWNSATPDQVALVLQYNSSIASSGNAYLSLTGLDINIDGDVSSHKPQGGTQLDSSNYNRVSRDIYTSSSNVVVIPYSLLERMVAAKDTRLRIHTSKGYEDSQFSLERIPGGQGTALLAVKDLMSRVAAIRPH